MTRDDVQKMFKLRFDDAGKQIYMWPDDIIQNTILAFAVSPTSASGYSGASPAGRYFAPANGPGLHRARADGRHHRLRRLRHRLARRHRPDVQCARHPDLQADRSRRPLEHRVRRGVPQRVQPPNFLPLASVNGNLTTGIGGSTLTGFQLTNLVGTDTRRTIQLVARINW
jgi:hypothetical protein